MRLSGVKLLALLPAALLAVGVFVVVHHGSGSTTPPPIQESVAPRPPSPTPSPTPPPVNHTTVLALATQANQARLLATTCLPTCHDVLLSSSDAGKTFLRPQPLPGAAVHYLGMALGPQGAIYAWSAASVLTSTNDGVTWTSTATKGVQEIQVIGSTVWARERSCHGACRDTVVAGKTGSSPTTWTSLPLLPRPALALSRVSTLTSYALASGVVGTELLTTRNGGRSFSVLPAPCKASSTNSVDAVDAKVIWLLCTGGARAGQQHKASYLSVDGGKHWKGPYGVPATGFATHLVAVTSGRAYLSGPGSAILATTSGGRSWAADTDPEATFGPICMTANGTLLAPVHSEISKGSGQNGSVWRHAVGGRWSMQVIAAAG